MTKYNLSFAGAGNVAGALCHAMHRAGHNIIRIVSISSGYAKSLASDCMAEWSEKTVFDNQSDVIIVAVPDNSLRDVLSEIRCDRNTLVVHTAGSYGLDIFPDHIRYRGVFYPLQTFSKGRETDFKGLPFLLEASDEGSFRILEELTLSLDSEIHRVDVERRKRVHLAAVFICNFTNHMLTAGKEISGVADIPFDWFEPLIRETVSKAVANGPEVSQTGPAIRNDRNTIEKHLELLSSSPHFKKLYYEVTESIINYHKKIF